MSYRRLSCIRPWRHAFLAGCAAGLFAAADVRAEVILQYFNTRWEEVAARIPEIAEAGYQALWLPPPGKGASGGFSVGYDPLDRFDLGDRDQAGTLPTKYGTRADLIRLVEMAHRFGLRVYFDNVMAHNGGPLGATQPGSLLPGVPGFVVQDFHVGWNGTAWQKFADWPDWGDEWQVLHRNPFSWDIASEVGANASFDPDGMVEGSVYPKWVGIRHPGRTDLYRDTDLVVGTNALGDPLHPFADKEPFRDVGLDGVPGTGDPGEGNGRFDWVDADGNGQHDAGETAEPFDDVGAAAKVPARRTIQWGWGDGVYNMGDQTPEDINAMLARAARWFMDTTFADGFRLDAVKLVPADFFGIRSGPQKDLSNAGMLGAAQEQHNLTRGFTDANHRDSIFDEAKPRDDAMMWGEHINEPPAQIPYLDAGMRIGNEGMQHAVRARIGSDLGGLDQPGFGHFNGTPAQSLGYVMSHDNSDMWGQDRPQGHAFLLLKEGLPVVYTDGYNMSGPPDFFPAPADNPFLGQFGAAWLTQAVRIHRDFARGTQTPRWSDRDFVAFERHDNRENALGAPWSSAVLLVMMAREYVGGVVSRPAVQCGFPPGARLRNYGPYGGPFEAIVQGDGTLRDPQGNALQVPSGGYFALGWRVPEMPMAFDEGIAGERRPIEIYQDGERAPWMPHRRTDGHDGDPAFNPHGLPDPDPTDRTYTLRIPRVTRGADLTFRTRADGTAASILLKLDGGLDLNRHLGLGPQGADARDVPPGIHADHLDDQRDGNPANDTVRQSATETYLGYEQMQLVHRVAEKFAAAQVVRNVIGADGAETYAATIGSPGFAVTPGQGPVTASATAEWVYHDPTADNAQSEPSPQWNPPPEAAGGQPVTLWFKVGYPRDFDRAWVYFTTDGSAPAGSAGTPAGASVAADAAYRVAATPDAGGTPSWWTATLPAMPAGTIVRYKIGAARIDAPSRFPWSEQDITIGKRMETVFQVDGFDATTATVYPHNDHGIVEIGLREGYHVLRARPFVGRTDGSSIYTTHVQTFYYDTQRPVGEVAFPREGDVLTGSEYEVAILTDETVTDVRVNILDADPTNDTPAAGNGPDAWAPARRVEASTFLRDSGWAREWRFPYPNVPPAGPVTLQVRLREASSAAEDALDDAEGWFTTLRRTATAAAPAQWHIVAPDASAIVREDDLLRIRFRAALAPPSLPDNAFLEEVAITVASRASGTNITPILQPRAAYALLRFATPEEHEVRMPLPNLFQGNPDFLHHIVAAHTRDGFTRTDSRNVRAAIVPPADGDADSLPDVWETAFGLDPDNPLPPHGGPHDFDGDGILNNAEFIVDTNPAVADAHRYPHLSIIAAPDDGILLQFPILPWRNHTLSSSADGTVWTPILSNVVGRTHGAYTIPLNPSSPHAAFRATYRMQYPE